MQSNHIRIDAKDLLLDLANMAEDKIEVFRARWWKLYHNPHLYSDEQLLTRRDELRLLWLNVAELPSPPQIPERAKALFESWISTEKTLEEHICDHWLDQPGRQLVTEWNKTRRQISPNPAFLSAMLVSGCLEFGDRFAFCWNPDCPKPYFIGDRKKRKYCSPKCAKPAQRAAKRKWWHENRGGKPDHA
jgi:hypothetical protein